MARGVLDSNVLRSTKNEQEKRLVAVPHVVREYVAFVSSGFWQEHEGFSLQAAETSLSVCQR
jgi:hypothetical protein